MPFIAASTVIMCKGNLPEIKFSDVKCSFRPRTSLGSAKPNRYTLEQEEQSVIDLPRPIKTDCSHEIKLEQDNTRRKTMASHFFQEDLSLEAGQSQIRPKTVKVTSRERALCNELITLSFVENTKKSNDKEHKREIVVFLPSEKPRHKDEHRNQTVLVPLPNIGTKDSQKHVIGDNFRKCKTSHQHDEEAFAKKPGLRHTIGLPLIGSQCQEKKMPLRRVKSHDIENHLRSADKNFDKLEAKAFLVYNWMKTQNELETL